MAFGDRYKPYPEFWTPKIKALEEIRERLGMTIEDYIQILGVSRMSYYLWRSGKLIPVSVTIKKLDAFIESKKLLLTSFSTSNSIVSGDKGNANDPDLNK